MPSEVLGARFRGLGFRIKPTSREAKKQLQHSIPSEAADGSLPPRVAAFAPATPSHGVSVSMEKLWLCLLGHVKKLRKPHTDPRQWEKDP